MTIAASKPPAKQALLYNEDLAIYLLIQVLVTTVKFPNNEQKTFPGSFIVNICYLGFVGSVLRTLVPLNVLIVSIGLLDFYEIMLTTLGTSPRWKGK